MGGEAPPPRLGERKAHGLYPYSVIFGQLDEFASFQATVEGRYRVPLALSGFHPGQDRRRV